MATDTVIRELRAYLDDIAAADAFSGAVLIAKGDEPLFTGAYGLASKGFGIPNTVETKFNLGSMNKMFTAVAIAQLVERGRLAFTDPIAAHLPDYPREIAATVTVHHLLTHTSGLGSYWTDRFEETKARVRTVRDYFPLFVDEPLAFTPGERFGYSNVGFIVLGAIVERASGQDYFDYVRAHVYAPAGMADTDAYELDRDVPGLTVGYTHQRIDGVQELEVWRNNLLLHVSKGGPAGGGYSTIGDLLRFATALRRHTLLAPPTTEIVLAGKVDTDVAPGVRYGYGFMDATLKGLRVVGHSGGFPGISAHLDMYPEHGYTVAVLSNYDPPSGFKVTDKARELIAATV